MRILHTKKLQLSQPGFQANVMPLSRYSKQASFSTMLAAGSSGGLGGRQITLSNRNWRTASPYRCRK
jgi:hypothetical protein